MLEKSEYLKIGKPRSDCDGCGKGLLESDRRISILVPAQEEQDAHVRRDFCPDCWHAMKDEAYAAFWVGRCRESDLPAKKLNRAERNVALAALFDMLAERNTGEEDLRHHLFFIAHLMMKYKSFRWRPSVTDPETGEVMLVFLKAGTGEEILVPDVEMEDEMVAKVKEEVENYLHRSTGQPIRL